MKKTLLLSAALAAVLLPLPIMIAHAQTETGGVDSRAANTRAARRAKEGGTKQAPMYPQTKREEPKQSGNTALTKQLAALSALQKDEKNDAAIAAADALIADSRATPYDRGMAAYIAAFVWMAKDTDTYTHVIPYLQRAISENSLPNNTHFQMMLQLAQMQMAEEKYADAIATADQFLTGTASEEPKAYAVKAEGYYRLKRYPESVEAVKKSLSTGNSSDNLVRLLVADYQEMNQPKEAAKVLEDMLAKKPNDKTLMMSLAGAYQDADEDAKAGAVFDRMRAAGLLTETKDYEQGYRILANIKGREKDAITMITDGLQKGILNPDYNSYSALGTLYYNLDQIPQAIDAWSKAAPLAKDGELFLNVGKLQAQDEKWAAAKAAAQQALAKGLKNKGDDWLVVARAEFGLGNKPAVLAAYREAAKYPETKKAAETALRQAAGK